jgi:quinolinate synthase
MAKFFAYTSPNGSSRVAINASLVIPTDGKEVPLVEDQRTHQMVPSERGQKTIKFFSGFYATEDKIEIEYLRNYNKEHRDANIFISEKATKNITEAKEPVIKEVPFIPVSIVKTMSANNIRELIKEQFSDDATGESVQDLIDYGVGKGYFK